MIYVIINLNIVATYPLCFLVRPLYTGYLFSALLYFWFPLWQIRKDQLGAKQEQLEKQIDHLRLDSMKLLNIRLDEVS